MAGSRILDGIGYFTEASPGTDYQGLSGFTICSWVYRAAAGTGNYSYPWAISNGTGQLIGLYWWQDNSIYMDVRNGTGVKYRAAAAGSITGMHHIAGVFDGSAADADRMKVYIDGVLQATTGTTSNPTATSSSLSGVYGMTGRIPAFAPALATSGHGYSYTSIHNVALNAAEILECMHMPLRPMRGRLHCWPMHGNESASTAVEPDAMGVHNLGGTSLASTSASMLTPFHIHIGGRQNGYHF